MRVEFIVGVLILLIIGGILLWRAFLGEGPGVETPGGPKEPIDHGTKPPDYKPPIRPPDIPPKFQTRVVVVKNRAIWDSQGQINILEAKKSLNVALRHLFGVDSYKEALKQIITPQDKVGLKVNAYLGEKDNATHPGLVDALSDFLTEVGVPVNNIIVWDRAQNELEEVGFKINQATTGRRCLATVTHRIERKSQPLVGFDDTVINVGNTTTRLTNILTKVTTVTINMPVLRTHKFPANTGVNAALQNMYHAIELTEANMGELYKNECDPGAALVYQIPAIRYKTKLIICDALNPLYNGGPTDDHRYHTKYNGIIVGLDSVAVDTVGQMILQKIRDSKGDPKWPRLVSNYLATAGKLGLGVSDLTRIEVIERDLQ